MDIDNDAKSIQDQREEKNIGNAGKNASCVEVDRFIVLGIRQWIQPAA